MSRGGARPGAGRKKAGDTPARAKIPIYVRLAPAVVEIIDASKISRTKYIERAVAHYLKRATE